MMKKYIYAILTLIIFVTSPVQSEETINFSFEVPNSNQNPTRSFNLLTPNRIIYEFDEQIELTPKSTSIKENGLIKKVTQSKTKDSYRLNFYTIDEKTPEYNWEKTEKGFKISFSGIALTNKDNALNENNESVTNSTISTSDLDKEKISNKTTKETEETSKTNITQNLIPVIANETKQVISKTATPITESTKTEPNIESTLETPITTLNVEETTNDTLTKETTQISKLDKQQESSKEKKLEEVKSETNQLLSFIFNTENEENQSLELVLEKNAEFSLTKENNNMYKLEIKNILAKNNLLLPYYAPKDFKAINWIKAKIVKNDIKIEIETDDMRLKAIPGAQKIILKGS